MTRSTQSETQADVSEPELIGSVRQALIEQSRALCRLSKQSNPAQNRTALQLILDCKGHAIFSGMGKSGLVGRKVAATLASTGIPGFYIHTAEPYRVVRG